MAWPFTAHRTYVADSTPTIQAADLNDYEAYFGHIFSGTRTLKQLQVDGTGNNATTVGSGDILVSGESRAGRFSASSTATFAVNPDADDGAGSGGAPNATNSVGSDFGGYIEVLTGTTCGAASKIVRCSFAVSYDNTPKSVVLFPQGTTTWNLMSTVNSAVEVTGITASKFDISSNLALANATTYKWYYVVA